MNRFLTAYTVIVHENYSCTVPPSPIDGDMADADTHYPTVSAALDDLFEAVVMDEMPCRVTFNFERHDCDQERTCDRCGRVEQPGPVPFTPSASGLERGYDERGLR